MAYEIRQQNGFFEIRVWGETSTRELLNAVWELHARDPGKQACDLWLVGEAKGIRFADYGAVVDGILRMCPPGMTGNRSAIVVGDAFQRGQMELYRAEAVVLPFEVRVFEAKDEAVRWLTAAPGAPGA